MRMTASTRVHDALTRATGIDITQTNLRFLSQLDEIGTASVSQLAGVIGVSQPTASRSLLQLEDDGFVHREGDPADGRVVVYSITAKGRRARAKLRQHMHHQLATALEGLGPRGRRDLAETLTDFVARLRDTGQGRAVS